MDFLLMFDFQCILFLLVSQTIRLVWSRLGIVYSYSTSVAIVQSSHRYDLVGSWWCAWFCYLISILLQILVRQESCHRRSVS